MGLKTFNGANPAGRIRLQPPKATAPTAAFPIPLWRLTKDA